MGKSPRWGAEAAAEWGMATARIRLRDRWKPLCCETYDPSRFGERAWPDDPSACRFAILARSSA